MLLPVFCPAPFQLPPPFPPSSADVLSLAPSVPCQAYGAFLPAKLNLHLCSFLQDTSPQKPVMLPYRVQTCRASPTTENSCQFVHPWGFGVVDIISETEKSTQTAVMSMRIASIASSSPTSNNTPTPPQGAQGWKRKKRLCIEEFSDIQFVAFCGVSHSFPFQVSTLQGRRWYHK